MVTRWVHLLLLGLLLACIGVVQAQEQITLVNWQAYKTPIKVACVGDSITAGVGASGQANSYPGVLGKLLGERFLVQNFGVSGATLLRKGDLPYWSTGAYTQATDFAPDVVIIKLGTNDSKPQNWAHKDEFAADCRDLITHFAALPSKPRVWVCLPVPAYSGAYGIRGDVIKDEVIPIIKQVATDTKTPVLDLFTAMSDQPQFFPDGIHPNDAGYKALAGHIHRLLTGAPVIAPAGEIFLDPISVTMTPSVPGTAVHYTLDGSMPTQKSPRYTKPLTIKQTTTVNAISLLPNGETTVATTAVLTLATLRKPENPTATQPGLAYQYYEADAGALDKLETLTPVKTGTAVDFSLGERGRDENIGLRYTGYVTVPRDGIYTFATTSDDGSALYIGETKVVDNGGMHGMVENSGAIALAAGTHAITITFYQGGGGYGLQVTYAGPGIEKQAIPATALSHVAE